MYEPRDDESVRHLQALGYVDPLASAARDAAVRRELDAEFQQALKRYEEGDIQEAGRRCEQLIADDPDWVAPRQLLAEALYRIGRWADAQLQLDWLTVHGVEHPRLALIAGAIALAKRDFSTALEVLKYAAHVEPTLPSVHTLLGTVYRRLGELDKAEDAFLMGTTRNPADAHALEGLAAIDIRRSDFSVAANFALEALDRDMQLFSAHYRLGVALAHLDRPHEAISAFEMSAKTNGRIAAPYYWLSRVAANQLNDPALAQQFRDRGREVIRRRRNKIQTAGDVSRE
jgi:predicted Zn-dependent protease